MKKFIEENEEPTGYQAVTIGASAGGIAAISKLLPGLPEDFPLPIIIVQHMSEDTRGCLTNVFQKLTPLVVTEALDKMPLEAGKIYLAPPKYHLIIEEDFRFTLTVDGFVNYCRPSLNVFFESASEAFEERLIGVVLTGANDDGATGLEEIKAAGGITIVQDPEDAEMATMPTAAIKQSAPDHIVKLEDMPALLYQLACDGHS